ncbi:TWiK family of potassium channels protein 7-like isoform X2 [Chrysoperla carnea]|uniref:TWiK family of potassium channels protein 7-like isoform X2 n=1 Tax=Chrysoperla carnea TaxID=189513 RepID=UPI001D087E84|nr:TWiK family of potassium channels protein 7-like isoform X2 [Chrysoperla carnea]
MKRDGGGHNVAGDSSNNVGTYLEQNNQHKNHDYIDDVLSFQPHYNQNKQDPSNNLEQPPHTAERNYRNKYISIGVQASPLPPYRLRVLPKCPQPPPAKKLDEASLGDEVLTSPGCLLCIGFQTCGHCLGRVFMSQCGLGLFLFAWALLGAAAFHFTEGPFELSEAQRLKALQNDLVVGLATDLRLVDNLQPAWRETIEKYIDKHEVLLLESVSSGYGEGGGKNGQIWSYPGCILFAISLLTTLGFGAPVPRTTMGRTTAVVFSAIGIPLHFLLILNIGMVLARRLQRWSTAYPSYTLDNLNEKKCHSFDINIALPKWLNWFPVGTGIAYYILGTLIFGVARSRKFESFLFPLDFTATGGVGLTPGYMRIGYGLYLEGAVILGGIAISLLQNSATSKLTDIGLKLGLLTNS